MWSETEIILMIRIRRCLAVLLLLAGSAAAFGQTKVKVSGVITSADDGLPLIGAAVMDSGGNGAITDLDGKYEIVAESGT